MTAEEVLQGPKKDILEVIRECKELLDEAEETYNRAMTTDQASSNELQARMTVLHARNVQQKAVGAAKEKKKK